MQLEEAIDGFGRYQHMRGRSAGTVRSYGYLLQQWGRWLAGEQQTWQKATLADIERYLETYATTHARSSTSLLSGCLKSFYKFARRKGYVKRSPAAELEAVTRDRPQPRPLPDDQVRALLAALDELAGADGRRNRLIGRTLLFTGIRIGELAALRWPDIDLQARTIRLVRRKGGRGGVVAINDALYADLVEFAPADDRKGPIWRCSRGALSNAGISQMFREVIQRELGFEGVTAHVLRHTFGTKLRRLGRDLRTIQEAMGHAKTQTTAIYTAVYDAELHDALNLLTPDW